MITLENSDLPIDVAKKIITGTKTVKLTPMMQTLRKGITGIDEEETTEDMFNIDEIKEIADYLLVYYNAHENGD